MVKELDVYHTEAGRTQHYAEYTELYTLLVDFERLALGLTSGSVDATPTDIDALYALMRLGNDLYIGSNQGRTAGGYDGDDTLYGMGGDDWLVGGRGIDSYFGGRGHNGVSFLDGTATEGVSIDFTRTTGNILNDGHGIVETAFEINMAEGTDFADRFVSGYFGTFYGHGGNDTMTGGNSGDTFDGGAGVDEFFGGPGNDELSFVDVNGLNHAIIVDLSVTTGPQILNDGFGNAETALNFENVRGTPLSDSLTGDTWFNKLWGMDGNDTLTGGARNDSLYGGNGNDRIYGGNGDDGLYNGDGNSKIYGGIGDDGIEGGKGKDSMDGGSGSDVLGFWNIGRTGHGAIVDLGRLRGNILDDGYGNTETATGFEILIGSNKNDVFTGNDRANFLAGERGNDRLNGSGGADRLYGGYDSDKIDGGMGNDTVVGGYGLDTVTGGEGADLFVFNAPNLGESDVDHVVDFQVGVDKIIFNSSSIGIQYADLLPAGFLSGPGMTTPNTLSHWVIYDTTTGNLYFDEDGTGTAIGNLIAVFDNHATLTYDMFSFALI